jgi:Family of unknown function (DUF5681)
MAFSKGQSGNPAGKPPGARHRATMAAEALLDGEVQALTRKAIERALEGDGVALRLCLERILPPRKDRPVSFALQESSKLTSNLIAAVAAGDVTPDEGLTVASLIEKHVRIREASDFEARLKALEERIGDGDGR